LIDEDGRAGAQELVAFLAISRRERALPYLR